MSLRAEHRALTRRRIVDAVLALVAEGTQTWSVPDVARRSGVSVPTIYRYFPTKEHLLDAAAEEPALRSAGEPVGPTIADGAAFLRKVWASFPDVLPLVRRQAASDAGRELRARRYAASRAYFEGVFAREGLDPASHEGARLVRLALTLTSSLAFLDLHDRQGRTPDEAADDVTWALQALAAATEAGRR